ncbi:MAG TPA: MBOAT family O-acyltransferase [Chthoniobacteraceae bacterium]|nr:MBOAT family O-acyltransferase [Chthoniobacteraceae bacterium]
MLGIYFILPRLARNFWLLAMSLLFYTWGEHMFVVVFLVSMTVNFFAGLVIHWCREWRHVKWLLWSNIAANLALLIFYKYSGFLAANLNALLAAAHLPLIRIHDTHLPFGISFFTFHAISYVVDVYCGNARVQKNPLNFFLYESLFPQLIAGPIIRYRDIGEQIDRRRETLSGFAYGVIRFVTGLSKKMLVANLLAVKADTIFTLPAGGLSAGVAWLGAICYTLQIYFDFSGYSDMAIGLGHMLGFQFVENFNYPYISRSIQEFWRRWHISLSTWFRDYLYIPLGGSRVSPFRTYVNLVTVFFLCGLWHGASWNFVIWGMLHGAFLVLERQKWMAWLDRVWAPLRHGYALLVIIVGWVFFRSNDLGNALDFLHAMCGGGHAADAPAANPAMYLDGPTVAALCAAVAGSMPVLKIVSSVANRAPALYVPVALGRIVALSVLFVLCAIQLASGTYNPFIYFRF